MRSDLYLNTNNNVLGSFVFKVETDVQVLEPQSLSFLYMQNITSIKHYQANTFPILTRPWPSNEKRLWWKLENGYRRTLQPSK